MEILQKNLQLKGEHYVLHIKGERVIDVKKWSTLASLSAVTVKWLINTL